MSSGYGSGQRMPAQQTYEAPACVQNAMMTKDKKPFTYTPGGIDLSQIKSERMAKRLARNAQAEGATGQQQHNRPTQPQSPGGTSPGAAASMGAAAMGMPFQVLPPPPPPGPGKNLNGGSAPAPPPPPPSSSNFSNTGTLAPPTNGNAAGGRGSAPNSPSMARKSPTPQRFEPPPMGFRPEIKIPPNPMAALRKVPPPVEKNTFWKEEYAKERSKSPMVERPATNNTDNNDSVNSSVSSPQTNASNGTGTTNFGETNINYNNSDNIDGFKKTMPTTNTTNNNIQQQNQTNNNFTNYQPQQQQQTYTPPTPNQQQSPIKPNQQSPQYGGSAPSPPPPQPQQQQQSSRPEFRSVAAPQSPTVNVYTRQNDNPRTMENTTPPRATESPFKFAQQQQQQRAPSTVSPLAQESSPSSAASGASVSPNTQAQAVPWRTQRSQNQQQQPQAVAAPQSHPQAIYNNVQQQQQQRSPDFTNQPAYQGPKPTNVGSLYIAPLAPPTEPQAQHIVRQQLQQQQRDSPMRQMAPQQQQPNQGTPSQQLRWMSTQPMSKEQPAWVRPEENGNVIPSSLNRMKSPPPPAMLQQQPMQQPQSMYQPLNPGNGFIQQTSAQNFGAQPITSTGLRLQINPQTNQTTQNGPRERIIPIQLESTPTPTYTPAQPSFNNQQQQYGGGNISPAPGYVVRTPNQFVDQGYNNFSQQQQQQRVMSPNLQQLNAPRMVQQTQNNVVGVNKTHIIPIAMENNDGTRGPISKTPIVIQNDLRTPPIQSKSFRILQKITDTIDDGSNDENANQRQQRNNKQDNYMDAEPQLQRPTFARQMSAQQARNSPTVEQMKRMQIAHEQGNQTPTTPSKLNQQRSLYANNDNSQQYIPPSEQQVPEPKKYTGSAIPSRSFKILQAMTQPENADDQENSHNNEMNDFESKPELNNNSYASTRSATVEPVSSSCSTNLNSNSAFSSSPSPIAPPTQPMGYPPYPYPYGYPWYPTPPHKMAGQNGDNTNPSNWHYPYGIPHPPPHTSNTTGENTQSSQYPPYPYYYPYYPVPPYTHQQSPSPSGGQISDFDSQNPYSIYMPPPPPYVAYPYPVAPSYSQSSNSSRASSVLPDIIITPSTDELPSKVILQHHIKKEKEQRPQRPSSIDIEDVSSLKSNNIPVKGTVVDILIQNMENISQSMENNLNLKRQTKKTYIKDFEQKSPEDNTSPVQITMVMTESEQDSENTESSDSEVTPKQCDKKNAAGPVKLQSIKSVNNLQIYHKHKFRNQDEDSEADDDDETTADGESDIFDEDDDHQGIDDLELEQRIEQDDSECEEFIIEDNLSVIYEEESESDLAKTVIRGDRSSQSGEASLGKDDDLVTKIEENDDNENEEEEREDSTSVTVRLPLKFSFSNTSNDDNIGTVEIGKSQVEEKRNSLSLSEKRNSFSVACVKSDSEDEKDYDDCDVSVTISLTHSGSRSGSIDGRNIEHQNMADIYPIEDMPVPDEAFENIESSQEDVSVCFSVNMHNKLANEALFEEPVELNRKEESKPSEAPEELDFFATLMATKMQAQKIKEQSANYWGKSTEKKDVTEEKEKTKEETKNSQENKNSGSEETEEIEDIWANREDEEIMQKSKFSFWDNPKATTEKQCNAETQHQSNSTKESKEMGDIWAKHEEIKTTTSTVKEDICTNQPEVEGKKPKFSFGNNCSKQTTETKETEQILDIWAERVEDKDEKKPKFSFSTKLSKEEKSETYSSVNKQTEVVVDIWADRVEDFPPIKPIKSKLKPLETLKDSFWSTVAEANKISQNESEVKKSKPTQKPEAITNVEFNTNILRFLEKDLPKAQKASVHYEEVSQETQYNSYHEEETEVDFWAHIESTRESKTPDRRQLNSESNYMASFGQHETRFWNDEERLNEKPLFDPLKYPEEPREVDTDEEIDFWAEIEAKRQPGDDDDNVTFHKSASFWASRDRQNSVDETPFKPVLPKAFKSRLPDEPLTDNMNIWADLEAHKGEEPVIIDPEVEEENALAQEYDQMSESEEEEDKGNFETASVHEPVIVAVWTPPTQQEEPEIDFRTEIHDIQKSNEEVMQSVKPERDELEVKRSNYRKAMAFFTTSVDDHKDQNVDRYERSNKSMQRNSYIDETEKWDWDAVSEAIQKENKKTTPELTKEDKELTPQATTPTKTVAEETEAIQNVNVEPTLSLKVLPNGLPDLEVNKLNEQRKISVKDRISAFETNSFDLPSPDSRRNSIKNQSLSVESYTRQSSLSRNSSCQRSESEMDEDDSGVTDMNKQLSETDTESDGFPELRKMSSYQRAATHSRLFKLLLQDTEITEESKGPGQSDL